MSRKAGNRPRYRTNTQDLDWHEERADAAQKRISEMRNGLFPPLPG